MSRLSFIKVSVIVLIAVLVAPSLMASEEKTVVVAPIGTLAKTSLLVAGHGGASTVGDTFFRQAATTNITATWRSATTTNYLEIVKEAVVEAGGIAVIEFGDEMEPAWRDSHELMVGIITIETEGTVPTSASSVVVLATAVESALGGRPAAEGTSFTLSAVVDEKFDTGVAFANLSGEEVTCTFTSGNLSGQMSITPPDLQTQAFVSEILAQAPIGTSVAEGAMNVQIACDQMVAISALLQNKTTGVISTTPVVSN